MESITIYLNSDIANIASTVPCYQLSELNHFARKETVELVFKYDYCRITAKTSRKVKVPKKITNSAEDLLKWIEHKIVTAWK